MPHNDEPLTNLFRDLHPLPPHLPFQVTLRDKVARRGDKLVARLYNEYNKSTIERVVHQVVVENGTLPAADQYMDLKDRSSNLGEVDIAALIGGRP